MSQSIKRSWQEAIVNILVGYTINFFANLIVFRSFGYNVSVTDNILIGGVFTVISLVRQFVIRRWFSRGD